MSVNENTIESLLEGEEILHAISEMLTENMLKHEAFYIEMFYIVS
jgi:hypothetical protein